MDSMWFQTLESLYAEWEAQTKLPKDKKESVLKKADPCPTGLHPGAIVPTSSKGKGKAAARDADESSDDQDGDYLEEDDAGSDAEDGEERGSLLRIGAKRDFVSTFKRLFSRVICDEVHAIRNPGTKNYKSVERLEAPKK